MPQVVQRQQERFLERWNEALRTAGAQQTVTAEALQERALGLFTEALCHGGFLGLGSKETLRFSQQADFYNEVVPHRRIYQKRLLGA